MSRSEENNANVNQIIRESRRLTIRIITKQANTDRETVREVLTEDIDMRKVNAKIVTKDLLTLHCL
jgi:hypothetical protein